MIKIVEMIKRWRVPVLILAALVASPVFFAGLASAQDAVCVFVSQKDNAWVIRKDNAIKQTLKVGDALYDGDRLVVMRGNAVQLAFDKQAQNVIHIEGESELLISGAKPTHIDMPNGKLFAVLNKKGPESLFKVSTPTAVAAVRGTQFQVNTMNQQAQILTYQGSVRVSGRDAKGEETQNFVIVNAGQKTAVAAQGAAPQPTQKMTNAEQMELASVLTRIDDTKKTIDTQGGGAWFERSKSIISGSSTGKKAAKDEKGRLIL